MKPDVMVDTYWLFVSTVEMPLIVEPAEVPVYYVDSEDNANVLHYEVVLAYYDQDNIISADTALVPANYTLLGDASAAVTVDELGQATPEWVTFYFQAQAVQGTFSIYYTDTNGAEIASSQTQTLDPGTYTVTPTPSDLPSGYVLSAESPAQVDVTIDAEGNVSPEVVTFMYEPQIVTGYLTVNYTDENSTPLVAPEILELSTGSHTVTPNPALVPSGYVLSGISQTQFDVAVDSQGGVTPTSVTFYYTPEQVTPCDGRPCHILHRPGRRADHLARNPDARARAAHRRAQQRGRALDVRAVRVLAGRVHRYSGRDRRSLARIGHLPVRAP